MSQPIPTDGLTNTKAAHWNLSAARLYEEAVRRGEGMAAEGGALVVSTTPRTGRSPNDKFIVKDAETASKVNWGKQNRAITSAQFEVLHQRALAYLQNRDVFVLDAHAGADPRYRLPIRVITETAWHNLFARNLFIPAEATSGAPASGHVPQFTVINVPNMHAAGAADGLSSEAFVLVDFTKRVILIGGTRYAGEIKKSIFTVMNYLCPQKGVLPMHSSANIGVDGSTTVFFGLSGTGKTTLSADPTCKLIGDDEHGWSDDGVFNFEGGCYAKVIRLSPSAEPEIYATTRTFGTVLENVTIDPTSRAIDLDSEAATENTRAAYPLRFIPNHEPKGMGPHPKNIVMLCADAFGVLPPISKLTAAQARYHFLSGYTAKVAGTEAGVKEPSATFSTCYGAPFFPMHPSVYAKMLGEKIQRHGVQAWLVNTGWVGGPYGTGKRISIAHTRALLHAALSGQLKDVKTVTHPVFNLEVPVSVPGVPNEILRPRDSWSDPKAYDAKAAHLAKLFIENFGQYEAPDLVAAGPRSA